jgi:hypothetical protein
VERCSLATDQPRIEHRFPFLFVLLAFNPGWDDKAHGCRGVHRSEMILRLYSADCGAVAAASWPLRPAEANPAQVSAWQFDRSKSAVVINLHEAENMNNSKNKNAAAAELALKAHVLAFDPEIMAEVT